MIEVCGRLDFVHDGSVRFTRVSHALLRIPEQPVLLDFDGGLVLSEVKRQMAISFSEILVNSNQVYGVVVTEIETLGSKTVYKNKWMTVREDRIRRSSGNEGIYGVVEKPDYVAILPVQDQRIHLVEQYRYPVHERYWEVPQGSWESDPDADHALVAAGELREETGLVAKTLTHIGYLYQAYGYSNQGYHVYLATDLEVSTQDLDEEEEGLIAKSFCIKEFESMIVSGVIKDNTTITAYSLAKLKNQIPQA